MVIAPSATAAGTAKGQAKNQYVAAVRVEWNGKGYVEFKNPLLIIGEKVDGKEPKTCANYEKMLAYDTNTPAGKAIHSLALSAFMAKKRIYAIGKGECTIYKDQNHKVEDWGWGDSNNFAFSKLRHKGYTTQKAELF